jgi:hypothetical protein
MRTTCILARGSDWMGNSVWGIPSQSFNNVGESAMMMDYSDVSWETDVRKDH